MKQLRRIVIALAILFLTACGTEVSETPVFQGKNPYAPRAGDSDLLAEDINIEWDKLYVARSQPPQLLVYFTYFPPTNCHKLRVEVSEPNDENQIILKAYVVAAKDQVCTTIVLEDPLEAGLNLGSFPKGNYTVVLNGDQVGEFHSY
jgi:hypothetical protein